MPEFKLPDTTHVGGVHLQVSDLSRSLEYYEQVIGLRARERSDASISLTAAGDGPGLVTLHSRPGVTRARRGALGLYHFALLLPDRAALGRFAAHLRSRDVPFSMADHLVSEALYLWDPDGLGIEVYVDRPREMWQRRGDELVMTVDPLDLDAVVASGRGERWIGAPRSTKMGHVHLHVGSLDEAEAFYHRGLGLDKTLWSFAGALFLSAGGYHHHLGTNVWSPGPAASADEAQLLEWQLVVPAESDVAAVGRSLAAAGYHATRDEDSIVSADAWGTRVRILTPGSEGRSRSSGRSSK